MQELILLRIKVDMKKICFIIIIIAHPILFAQSSIRSGTINFSGNFSFMSKKTLDPDNNLICLSFNPQVGYFVINNFSINISLDYSYESFDQSSDTYLSIGPQVKYYLPIKKIKPFISFGYLYTETIYSNSSKLKFPGQQAVISGGLDYFITNSAAIETILSYKIVTKEEPYYTVTGDAILPRRIGDTFLIGIGINIFL